MRFTSTIVALSLSAFIPTAFAQTVCGDVNLRTAKSGDCKSFAVSHFVNEDPKATIVKQDTAGKAAEICDHLVELQLVKGALELANGACHQVAGLTADQRKAKLKPIVDLANSKPNLFFVSKNPEGRKGDLLNAFLANKPFNANKKDAQVVAANSYLTQTRAGSTSFAAQVDALIAKTFPGTHPNVATKWSEFLTFAAAEAAKSQARLG